MVDADGSRQRRCPRKRQWDNFVREDMKSFGFTECTETEQMENESQGDNWLTQVRMENGH